MKILHVGKFLNGKIVSIELMTDDDFEKFNILFSKNSPGLEIRIIC